MSAILNMSQRMHMTKWIHVWCDLWTCVIYTCSAFHVIRARPMDWGGGREEGFHRLCLNRIQEFSKSLWLDAPTTITLSKRALSKISKIATRLSFSQCNVWEKCSFLGVHPPYPFSFVLFMRWCWHLKQNKVKWVNSFSTLKKDCQVLGCPLAHDN